MRRCWKLVALGMLLWTAGMRSGGAEPTPDAELIEQTGFSREALLVIRQETGGVLRRLSGYDENGFQVMAAGIAVTVPEDRIGSVLAALRRKLRPLDYQAFLIEENELVHTGRIGVLKGHDQFDILRIMQTNGRRQGVSHEAVLEALTAWQGRFRFEIIGAEHEWAEVRFLTLPKDLAVLAAEIFELCPDAADGGPGGIPALVRELRDRKRLLLSWE